MKEIADIRHQSYFVGTMRTFTDAQIKEKSDSW